MSSPELRPLPRSPDDDGGGERQANECDSALSPPKMMSYSLSRIGCRNSRWSLLPAPWPSSSAGRAETDRLVLMAPALSDAKVELA
eukprot:5909444-Karenia_brevis.AAC.1